MFDDQDFRDLREQMQRQDRLLARLDEIVKNAQRTLLQLEEVVTAQGHVIGTLPELARRMADVEREIKEQSKDQTQSSKAFARFSGILEAVNAVGTPIMLAVVIWLITGS